MLESTDFLVKAAEIGVIMLMFTAGIDTVVIDGNSIVNRAFYGVSQSLATREGQPTNAIFGFLNILNKLLDESAPDALWGQSRTPPGRTRGSHPGWWSSPCGWTPA